MGNPQPSLANRSCACARLGHRSRNRLDRRAAGVAHASGEYLLLMNDDTICAHNLLEEHLLVQREYASEQWAVLGNIIPDFPLINKSFNLSYAGNDL